MLTRQIREPYVSLTSRSLAGMLVSMKDRILSEIRRLAASNGGKAPGKALFQQETGIQDSEWYGKLWARWGDAVSEAGLVPNGMNERMSSDLVLDKFAEACRHYGKVPSSGELRMYVRATPGFISHTTFGNHFSSKENMVAALRARATERGDNDLLAILPQPKDELSPITEEASSPEGWVYLLRSGAHYKIGRSDEVEKRLKQISIALPDKVELEHAIRTDDPPGIEGYWHRRFADRRANGEWFTLSPKDVRAFKRRKFQ